MRFMTNEPHLVLPNQEVKINEFIANNSFSKTERSIIEQLANETTNNQNLQAEISGSVKKN